MKTREIKAIMYEAECGNIFINAALKTQKVTLIKTEGSNPFERKELPFGIVDQWIEVSFAEAAEIKDKWDMEKYEYFKILYG